MNSERYPTVGPILLKNKTPATKIQSLLGNMGERTTWNHLGGFEKATTPLRLESLAVASDLVDCGCT